MKKGAPFKCGGMFLFVWLLLSCAATSDQEDATLHTPAWLHGSWHGIMNTWGWDDTYRITVDERSIVYELWSGFPITLPWDNGGPVVTKLTAPTDQVIDSVTYLVTDYDQDEYRFVQVDPSRVYFCHSDFVEGLGFITSCSYMTH